MRLTTIRIIDPRFSKHARKYVTQSVLAMLAVAALLFSVEMLTHAVIVAAVGASTFIVFVMPDSITAQPRRLIGGHVVGLAVGAACHFGLLNGPLVRAGRNGEFVVWGVCALSVGLSIFLMAITNTEHPPAAATALGIVSFGWTNQTAIFILACAVGLAVARRLLRRYLIDLFAVRAGGTPDFDAVDRARALRKHGSGPPDDDDCGGSQESGYGTSVRRDDQA